MKGVFRIRETDGDESWERLHFAHNGLYGAEIIDDNPEPTTEELLELLEMDLEDRNFHSQYDIYRKLVKVIEEATSPETARTIIRAITERGGLI